MERALNQNESFDIDNKELKTIIFIEKIENSQFEKEISKIRKIYLNKKLNQKEKNYLIINSIFLLYLFLLLHKLSLI